MSHETQFGQVWAGPRRGVLQSLVLAFPENRVLGHLRVHCSLDGGEGGITDEVLVHEEEVLLIMEVKRQSALFLDRTTWWRC